MWRSTWDGTDGQWVTTLATLPQTKNPYLVGASEVLFVRPLGAPLSDRQPSSALVASHAALKKPTSPHLAEGLTLDVTVCVLGVVPDLCVRTRLGYVDVSAVAQPRVDLMSRMADGGCARAFHVSFRGSFFYLFVLKGRSPHRL